ncbi:Uu.00g133810.m01.CDS01 [Anthostomella pinea]|uniref:Uu.00g133810.m01.CDS01 n=1 Tax=Anthostomella pinea TaxID=933095 RepID=A0AAI8YKQ9_9PEZI|nr:Uu.00g133810.m01.CDS01 [Anthostomella pinea]
MAVRFKALAPLALEWMHFWMYGMMSMSMSTSRGTEQAQVAVASNGLFIDFMFPNPQVDRWYRSWNEFRHSRLFTEIAISCQTPTRLIPWDDYGDPMDIDTEPETDQPLTRNNDTGSGRQMDVDDTTHPEEEMTYTNRVPIPGSHPELYKELLSTTLPVSDLDLLPYRLLTCTHVYKPWLLTNVRWQMDLAKWQETEGQRRSEADMEHTHADQRGFVISSGGFSVAAALALRTEEKQQAAARERDEREKAQLKKQIKDQREALRKFLANRCVSFAAEAHFSRIASNKPQNALIGAPQVSRAMFPHYQRIDTGVLVPGANDTTGLQSVFLDILATGPLDRAPSPAWSTGSAQLPRPQKAKT